MYCFHCSHAASKRLLGRTEKCVLTILLYATLLRSFSLLQARTAKKISQKELATAINEKPQVVAEYESGKAIPNPQIISKLERQLGVKLPRPGKSKAATASGSGGAAAPKGTSGVTGKAAALTRGGPPKRR